MSDESNMLKNEVHFSCLKEGCNGNIIFEGLVGGIKYFRCCICEKVFENRRNHMIEVKKERRAP